MDCLLDQINPRNGVHDCVLHRFALVAYALVGNTILHCFDCTTCQQKAVDLVDVEICHGKSLLKKKHLQPPRWQPHNDLGQVAAALVRLGEVVAVPIAALIAARPVY